MIKHCKSLIFEKEEEKEDAIKLSKGDMIKYCKSLIHEKEEEVIKLSKGEWIKDSRLLISEEEKATGLFSGEEGEENTSQLQPAGKPDNSEIVPPFSSVTEDAVRKNLEQKLRQKPNKVKTSETEDESLTEADIEAKSSGDRTTKQEQGSTSLCSSQEYIIRQQN
jgi:hypothetical protein